MCPASTLSPLVRFVPTKVQFWHL